jgi:hypothetical protein
MIQLLDKVGDITSMKELLRNINNVNELTEMVRR